VPSKAFEPKTAPTDTELQIFYQRNIARYTLPERRVIRFARFDKSRVAAKAAATDAEIQSAYTANQSYKARDNRAFTQFIVPTQAIANDLLAKAEKVALWAEPAELPLSSEFVDGREVFQKIVAHTAQRGVKLLPGVETPLAGRGPKDIDFVVVRENTEDLYCGVGGYLKKGTPDEVAVQQAVYTRKGCERCIRWAFDYTRKRNSPKKTLTLVAKTNVLTFGHDLWWRTFQEVAKDYPDVKTDYNHVDACCMWMVKNPDAYDVIVTTNMFGDIITDLGGILQGGMGVAAGANLNPDKGGVSMFEPMGGSAPKYTGQNVINPIAAINAMAMLLEHSGHPAAGARIDKAVAHITGTKMKSQAAGKMGHGTREVGDLVVAALCG
jgi:3-isopropylmalate dehydrogenase